MRAVVMEEVELGEAETVVAVMVEAVTEGVATEAGVMVVAA